MKAFTGILLIVISFHSCNLESKKTENQPLTNIIADSLVITKADDSLQLFKKLIPNQNNYISHYYFNSNLNKKLLLISSTNDSSDCISEMYFNNCKYLELSLYNLKFDKFSLVSNYKIPDYSSRIINKDSLGRLYIETYFKYSGYSSGHNEETYQLQKDSFILKTLNVNVKTKEFTGLGTTNFDEWDYTLDFSLPSCKLIYSKIKFLEDTVDTKDIISTINFQSKVIKLGQPIILDEIIGEENVHYYH